MSQKFFLYARKSTDVEDKQVLSIEAQLTELREYAKRESITISAEVVEKQSAKYPGRPLFNKMLDEIEKNGGNILAWNPDRLARNSVDGGRIIYLLDCGQLLSLKFPTFWCDTTSQGKFMLNIAFGQSKYYVDSLAENTKRGLRQKVRRGEYPSLAPVGYINDSRTKTVIVDKKKSVIIRKAFELYVKNESRLEDISNFLAKHNLFTKSGKRFRRDRITFMLSNPFYYGLFRYSGEVHEGKHQPIISKKLFDEAQEILKERSRPQYKVKNQAQVYCGLISCASCGMMITGEYKVKKQKNGNIHEYVYYHCTKKSKTVKCAEPCIRQEQLDIQLSSLIKSVSLKSVWAEKMRDLLAQDEKTSTQTDTAFVEEKRDKIKNIQVKLQRLLDSYLDQDIEKEIYVSKKSELLSEKKSLEEQISSLLQKRTDWLEPMRNWIGEAENMDKIADSSSLFEKKTALKKIFGSNLLLQNKSVRASAPDFPNSPAKQTQDAWASLRLAHASIGLCDESQIVVRDLGIEPRTFRVSVECSSHLS